MTGSEGEALAVEYISKQLKQLGMAPLSSRAADNIRSQFRIRGGGFSVVLVGKDGGVKARYAKAPDLDDVFSLIDGMPMRRSEMRERGLSCDAD